MTDYTPDPKDVEIVAQAMSAAFREFTGTRPGDNMWNLDMERTWEIAGPAALTVLAEAGRLLPGDAERVAEYGVWWHIGDSDGIAYSTDAIGDLDRAHQIGKERIGDLGLTRYTLHQRTHRHFADGSSWVGPWVPVPKPDPDMSTAPNPSVGAHNEAHSAHTPAVPEGAEPPCGLPPGLCGDDEDCRLPPCQPASVVPGEEQA